MREIPLTKGCIALVDDEDFEKVSKFKWFIQKNKTGVVYAKTNDRKNKTTLFMHRFILDLPRGVLIDHVNGVGLDNTRKNLRLCTKQQNSFNSKKMEGCYSKFKGVSVAGNRWRAFIKANGKHAHIGCYATELEAANAYNEAAKKYHGEFAKLNNITPNTATAV